MVFSTNTFNAPLNTPCKANLQRGWSHCNSCSLCRHGTNTKCYV